MERILASPYFSKSARLSQFLRYIVEEQIAGRGEEIKGKTIAVRVYEREIDATGSAQNLVRVEAKRLRRSLDEYYSNEGSKEALKIVVKPGGYCPSFVTTQASSEEDVALAQSHISGFSGQNEAVQGFWIPRRAAILTGLCFVALVAMIGFTNDERVKNNDALANDSAELAALRERSMASVQAINIANQTRGAFFPLFDIERQMIALNSFEHATKLDPELPAGYAGTAQVLALLSMLNPDVQQSETQLLQALENSALALDIDPTDAWANAARAWVLAVAGEHDEALRRSRIAMDLAPEDGHSLDLVGIAAFLAGDASLSTEASDPSRPRTGDGRFGANNIWGVAQLALENYEATIEAFSTSAQRGLPVSGPTLLLLATAYQQTGDTQAARAAIAEMRETWPDFPAEAVAARFFERHPEMLLAVNATLNAHNPTVR